MQLNLLESFAEFKEFKNVDKETLMAILEEVFRNMIIKKYGSDENFDIIINPEKGDLEIWRNREIVKDGEVEDENIEVALGEALKVEDDFEVGEELSEEIKLESFGRRNVLSLRQNLAGRILDMEKDALYTKYKERVGEVVTAEVYQIWKREMLLVDDEDNEVVMPREHQIPGDFFKKGDTVKAVVAAVELRNNTPRITFDTHHAPPHTAVTGGITLTKDHASYHTTPQGHIVPHHATSNTYTTCIDTYDAYIARLHACMHACTHTNKHTNTHSCIHA